MKQRNSKRATTNKLLTAIVTASFLAIVPMAAPAFAVSQGNPPSVECGSVSAPLLNPLYNKFQIGEDGSVSPNPEFSTPPGLIITLEDNGDGTYDYTLTDDDYVITRIVMKHGQTADIVLNNPASTGTIDPASDISHITFCFATAPVDVPVAVSVSVLPCTETSETTPVSVSVPVGATLTILKDGTVVETITSTDPDTISLPAGNYTWTAEADDGFVIEGDDSGAFTVEACEEELTPLVVDVDLLPCTETTETTPVDVTVPAGATVTILQGETVIDTLTSDETLSLPAGNYTWTAEADEGFVIQGDDSGAFTVEACEGDLTPLDVSVALLPCTDETLATPVLVTVPAGATVTIFQDGAVVETVTSTETLDLFADDYTWTATADEGFVISGDDEGSFTVDPCVEDVIVQSARVDVDLGACEFVDGESVTPVTVGINPEGAATVVLTDEEGRTSVFGDAGGSQDLLPGVYTYEIEAADGFALVGASSGTLSAEECVEVLGTIERRRPEVLARTGLPGTGGLTVSAVILLVVGMVLIRLSLGSVQAETAVASPARAFVRRSVKPLMSRSLGPPIVGRRRRRRRGT